MFEIDDIVTESSYETMMAMLCAYEKALVLESHGLYLKDDNIFQEGNVPERKTTLEKVIWFIPDMIRKFIEFIKKKLNKLFGKNPTELTNNIKETITGSKDNESTKKKVITALAAVGLTAVVTAAGYVIYDKHKTKVLTFEADNSDVIGITVEYNIPNMIKSLESSVEVSTNLMKLSSTSDSSAYEEQYKSIIKKLRNATKSLDNAVKPNTSDGKAYTMQQLMKELKQLSDYIDKVDRSIKESKDKSFSNKSAEYEKASQELNNEISNWVNAFQTFMTKTSDFISNTYNAIEKFNSIGFEKENDGGVIKHAFEYLDTLICYNNSSPGRSEFTATAIKNPWQSESIDMKPSKAAFESIDGKDIIRALLSAADNNVISKPAWGRIKNTWFVLLPSIEHRGEDLTDKTRKGYFNATIENYGFIFKSDKEFSKMVQFIRNSTPGILNKMTRYMASVNLEFKGEDNPHGYVIHKDVLSKFMYASQHSATGLSKDLQPVDGEIFFNVTESADVQNIRDALVGHMDKGAVNVVPVKTKPGVMKLSKNKLNSTPPPISKEDALRVMDILESLDELNHPDRNKKGD